MDKNLFSNIGYAVNQRFKYMNIVSFTLFFSWILFFQNPLQAQSNDGWIFKNQKDNVKVYYKATGNVHQVKLTTSVQASLSGIMHLLYDVPAYARWGYKIMESKLLRKVSETEVYYYVRIDFPWPMSDRDLILHSKMEQNPVTRTIYTSSTSMPNYIPVYKDVVRMQTASTKWVLTPGNNGWTYMEYYLHSDPGGSIPDWAVNMAIDVGPRETINRMRTLLKRPEYKDMKLAHIHE
jgi:START domain